MTAPTPENAPPEGLASIGEVAGPDGRSVDDGLAGLIRLPGFAGLMAANVLSAVGLAAGRFVFVWLVGELTEWNPATAILGIVVGLPPLFLSAWAGSLVDRLDQRRFGSAMFAVSAVGYAICGVLAATDRMTIPLAMVFGFLTSIAPAMIMPLFQALVPVIVPPGRLMQGVAIQNMGMTVSSVGGLFLGGVMIQLFGIAAGFWLVTAAGALGAVTFWRTSIPDRVATTERRGAIRAAARVALGTEPLRSLLAITAVLGLAITTSVLMLPEFARDVLGVEALAASGLNVCMSIGMITMSMVLATRWTPTRPGLLLAVFSSVAIGGGLIAIGSSRHYAVTAFCAFCWGLSGGIGMTTLRTLTQVHTPPELMGRVMGLAAMAQFGAFPIAALLLFGLVSATSVSTAMILSGVICCVSCGLIAVRPVVLRL